MAITVANTANTNTFDYWRNRTNELAYQLSTSVITTDASGNTYTTSGNAMVNGTFTASTLAIGNATINVAIQTSNTVQQSNGQYFLNANGSWTTIPSKSLTSNTVTTTGLLNQEIDNYAVANNIGAEYLVTIKDNNANSYMSTKINSIYTGANVFSTEYATLISNVSLGVFNLIMPNVTHISLQFTPTSTNTTVNFVRTVC